MSFRCIKAFMHAFSGRFSRTCLEGISFNFFVCFIFNVSLGSAPKRKNFDIQRNTRVASGGQFTSNYHTPSRMPWSGARKYCQFSGKTENWYAFTGAQSKTQVALVRCSISVKELSIMHLITDYLRTHSAPLSLHIESETQQE